MAARERFLRLAHKTAHCISVLHLPCPLLKPPTSILLEPIVLLQLLMLLLEGARRPLVTFPAREIFMHPAHKKGTLDYSIAPALPTIVATRDDSAGKCHADANSNIAVRGDDAFNSPPSTGDVPAQNKLDVSTRTNRDNRISIAPPSEVDALQALVALAEWRAMP